ncbi:class I SAM-dependent methyltransferase [Nocardia speluncae]|uniref:Class I SAM-dependent methyltransferase n=1 Tax=Nocardia speluncae TaxID=419477 RepID=A0A846X874_9NOCA|nr:class I SAM-dependent methyltransferase [Nocardia speluncae]NKY32421.1 class I SAM-dependent methyltransferase [Nocardia speluncae]
MTPNLDPARARYWLERWDRQQERYMPDREMRFDVIGDVLTELLDRPDPLIVDLGVGPGTLAERLLARLPGATVVGVDADPLLLALCEAAHGSHRLRTVFADLREPGWPAALGLNRAPDAFVSTTALHWMNREPLRRLIRTCATVLPPGGIFVDGDHLYEGPAGPRLDALGRALTVRRAERCGTAGAEDWADWWAAVDNAPELAELVRLRDGGFEHKVHDRPTAHDYLAFAIEAGFAEAGTVWQYGDDRVVVAIR